MGSHGFSWVPMGAHGLPWFPWVSMGSHGFPWVSKGFPWVPVCVHGFQMGFHGFTWVSMGSHGFQWVPMGSHGFPWVPMGIVGPHGFPEGSHWFPVDKMFDKYDVGGQQCGLSWGSKLHKRHIKWTPEMDLWAPATSTVLNPHPPSPHLGGLSWDPKLPKKPPPGVWMTSHILMVGRTHTHTHTHIW